MLTAGRGIKTVSASQMQPFKLAAGVGGEGAATALAAGLRLRLLSVADQVQLRTLLMDFNALLTSAAMVRMHTVGASPYRAGFATGGWTSQGTWFNHTAWRQVKGGC
jgi:hypothetical protein